MKNKLILGSGLMIITVIVLSFSSCKKRYTCNCKEYVNGVESNSGGLSSGYKTDKSDAEHRCNSYEHSHFSGYNDTIETSFKCTLTQD